MIRDVQSFWRASVKTSLLVAMSLMAGCAMDSGETGRAENQEVRPTLASVRAPGAEREQPAAAGRHVMYFPTGERESSVIRLEQIMPDEIVLNRPFEYQVRVTNLTDRVLNDVVITQSAENLQVSQRGQQAQPTTRPAQQQAHQQAQPQAQGGRQFEVGSVEPRATRSITMTATPGSVGDAQVCTSVSYNPTLCVTASVINPQLRLTKSAPDRVSICDTLTWRYTVTNSGTGTARDIRVVDPLPEGLVTAEGGNRVAFTVDALPEGQSRSIDVRLKARQGGQYASQATAQSRHTQAKTDQIGTNVLVPQLAIKMSGPEQTYVNSPTEYRISITNTSEIAARDIELRLGGVPRTQITDITNPDAPPKLLVVRPDAAEPIGDLKPGETNTYTLTVNPTRQGQLNLSAIASGDCAEAVAARTTLNVQPLAALLLLVADQNDPVRVGQTTTYTIAVKNQGSGADTNVRITAELPQGLEFVEATGPTRGTQKGQTITFAPLQTLAPDQTVAWKVTARATQPGDTRFRVKLQSNTLTSGPAISEEPTNLFR